MRQKILIKQLKELAKEQFDYLYSWLWKKHRMFPEEINIGVLIEFLDEEHVGNLKGSSVHYVDITNTSFASVPGWEVNTRQIIRLDDELIDALWNQTKFVLNGIGKQNE